MNALNDAHFYYLRELRADVERLVKEDPSANVRRVARNVLKIWESEGDTLYERRRRANPPGPRPAPAHLGNTDTVSPIAKRLELPPAERAAVLDSARTVLNDPNESVRRKVSKLSAVVSYNLRELEGDLARVARHDPHARIREGALRILERWDLEDTALASAKAEEEKRRKWQRMIPKERKQAERAESKAFFQKHRDELLHDLKEGSPVQRRLAASTALTWVKYIPEALPIFREILKTEDDPGLQCSAIRVLGEYEGQKAVPLMKECLASSCPEHVRWTAAFRLARLGHREGITVLVELLRTQDLQLQVSTVAALRSVTGRHFEYPTTASSSELHLPNRIEVREIAIKRWENWWKQSEAGFVFPYSPR